MKPKIQTILIIGLLVSGGMGYIGAKIVFSSQIEELQKTITTTSLQYETISEDFEEIFQEHKLLTTQYSDVEKQYETLDIKYNDLENNYTGLSKQYDELYNAHTVLSTQFTELEYNYTLLSKNYNEVNHDYNTLIRGYHDLSDDYQLEKELRIGNSLGTYYDNLREGFGLTGVQSWTSILFGDGGEDQVSFAVNLAQHDLGRIYWTAYESDYQILTGEDSYETAYNKLSTIASYIDVDLNDRPKEKIKKILGFLVENIHYEYDMNDIFLAPVETLSFKSGDCDDYSILASALFEYFNVESAIGFFENDYNEYHAMVLVNLEDLGSYGCWYFDDLTHFGLDEGRWINIEPQTLIQNQGLDDIDQWSLLVAKQLED